MRTGCSLKSPASMNSVLEMLILRPTILALVSRAVSSCERCQLSWQKDYVISIVEICDVASRFLGFIKTILVVTKEWFYLSSDLVEQHSVVEFPYQGHE